MAARWKRKWSTGRNPQNHTTVHVQGDAPNHQTEQQWQDPASHSAQAPTQQLSPPSWELLPSLPHPPGARRCGVKAAPHFSTPGAKATDFSRFGAHLYPGTL